MRIVNTLKRTDWKLTMLLHLARSVSAGVVWGAVLLFTGATEPAWWAMPLVLPLMYFSVVPINLLIVKGIARFSDFGPAFERFSVFIFGLGLVVGDPIVYLLLRRWGRILPIVGFRPLNLVLFSLVSAQDRSTSTSGYPQEQDLQPNL